MNNQIPPFLLGEVEWDSDELLFWIPVQVYPDTPTVMPVGAILFHSMRTGVNGMEFRIYLDTPIVGFSTINTALNNLFYDGACVGISKWIDPSLLGTNYLGKNYLFQCTTGEPWSDLVLFKTPRTSSTNPSIEQVAGTLQLTPGDIIYFGGSEFTFGGEPIRF